MNTFERRQWEVTEYPFKPGHILHSETIYTIGNGLVGVRGSFEEGYPGDSALTLAAGLFNQTPDQLVPELIPLPNWLSLHISVNDCWFSLKDGKILGYDRTLNLKEAVLRRGVLWRSPNGDTVRFAFERFASLANPHVLAIQVLVQVLNEGEHTIEVNSPLEPTSHHPEGGNHWEYLQSVPNQPFVTLHGKAAPSGYEIGMASYLDIEGATPTVLSDPAAPGYHSKFEVAQNQKVMITKLFALHTSRDSQDPVASATTTLTSAVKSGYAVLFQEHQAAWDHYWQHFDIQIEGDEIAQRAVRFCTYHFLIASPTHEERVSIGAKTLSGHGYKGHIFWDTELFILPPVTLAQPDLARRLLMYRYHNLAGARRKAAEGGYQGAMFPWESTDTGEETTPRWVPGLDGNPIRIWTGDNEQHISTDIAYAVLQYWRWTGEEEWFRQYGAEIVLDTAKFWGSRVEYNQALGRYEIHQQIGPDEYHENIDNSVFTNRMVVWHLQEALGVWDYLRGHYPDDATRLARQLGLDDATLAHWQTIAEKMWIPMQGGVFEQFENFFQRLKPINLEDYTPRTTNMDMILGHAKTQVSRVIKQADVVMLMALLRNQLGDDTFLRRNWDEYSTVVDHGSSLSPAMHAVVAARLGLNEQAYDYLIYAATLDLDDLKGNVRDGIHAACCGGVWQAVVLGLCGLELTENGPVTRPHLPEHWRRVTFRIFYQGKPMTITVE
ncbi:MAG: glycoside hydrolase family 65 protein [Chloroflexi bacterium]|nr:glycoside hydrolase family 65 protein [Chloroflexota bacterium]